ncbi:MAG: glyoxalase/bleomycin resistance/extradiol dioxygenase family protein [Acidobacteria bacterium]|nr:MAG: glyoxalase/bleomycin resistance/extradiol dioxygenase family protein [Acidobacteriota bacterium]
MIDHAVVRVKDFKKSRRFYESALQPLGYRVLKEFPGFVGLGAGDKTDVWIGQDDAVTKGVHLAFASRDRKSVDAFHAAALKAGGKDNGPPGIRKDYHPAYYGAFVLDPEGNNIEAVCHDPKG